MGGKRNLLILFIPTFLFFLVFRGLALWVRIELIPEPNDIIDPAKTLNISFFSGVLYYRNIFKALFLSTIFMLVTSLIVKQQSKSAKSYSVINMFMFTGTLILIYLLYRFSDMLSTSKEYFDFLLTDLKSETLALIMFYPIVAVSLALPLPIGTKPKPHNAAVSRGIQKATPLRNQYNPSLTLP